MKPVPPDRRSPSPSRRDLLGLSAGLGAGLAASAGLACRSLGPDMNEIEPDPLDELFSDLTDQRSLHLPISRDERAARMRRLGRLLDRAELDALLIEPGSTMRYLTELEWGLSERLFALVVFADGSSIWLCPAFEGSRAERKIEAAGGPHGTIVRWQEDEQAFDPLAGALLRRGASRIAVEPRARSFVFCRLAETLGAKHVVSGAAVVRQLRAIKDEHEIALLRGASELTQRAVTTVGERLRPGMSDREIERMLLRAQARLGLHDGWAAALIGEDAALPHGGAGGRKLEVGDSILVDTGGSLHDYQSDCSRSWTFSASPTREYERVWNAVRDAQRAAFDAIAPGVAAREIDLAARRVIGEAGLGAGYESFTHRLGHGIGIDGHEEPYIDGGNPTPLAAGMTFTNEPGVYLPWPLGVRLEDVMVVTPDGADHLGAWATSPRSAS
jgi:Xaa-Pro dipeptidase